MGKGKCTGDHVRVVFNDKEYVYAPTKVEDGKLVYLLDMEWQAVPEPLTFEVYDDDGKVSLDDPVSKYLPEFKEHWVVQQIGLGPTPWGKLRDGAAERFFAARQDNTQLESFTGRTK